MSEVQQHAARRSDMRYPSGTARSSLPPTGRDALPALATAAAAALLASSCCLLPLVLVSVGLSGAWLGHLRALQPYSPIFITIAITALLLAGRSLFSSRSRSTASCSVGSVAARPLFKTAFWLIAALTLILLVMPVVAPWFY
jgi:mercuric ion transport protein